jgi:hypothetical protein
MSAPPTGMLFYDARAKPLSTTGLIQPGSYYQFYKTGTLTLTNVYADGALVTPLSQVPGTGGTTAASDGRLVAIYLDPTVVYRYQLYSATNVLLADIDPYIPAPILTQVNIGTVLYPQTSQEAAASVTPTNFFYPPLTVDRYGTNTTPGTTSMGLAFQTAINVAKKGGGTITFGPGPYLIDIALDLTFPIGGVHNASFAIIGQGRYKATTFTQGIVDTPSLILKHAGNAFDCTGNLGVHFENLSICTDQSLYPQTCFLLARNTDGGSRSDRFVNCYVAGYFHQTILYNFGAEDGMYSGCQFYNYAPDSNTSVFDITAYNARSVTSAFTTIQNVVPVSCLDHKVFGGEFANLFQGSGATADVFRFDAARQIKIYGPWMDCTAKASTSQGRSLFYIDGTHGPCQGLFLHDIDGEAAVFPANYGIFVTNNAQTHSNWVIEGCWFPNTITTLGGGTGSTISTLSWINTVTGGLGNNINFSGSLVSATLDASGTAIATSIDNFTNTLYGGSLVQNNGEVDVNFRDFSQASGSQWKKIRASGGALLVSSANDIGTTTVNNVQFNTSGASTFLGKIYPVKDDLTAQAVAGIYGGSGVPNNANGSNGDFYFRGDTPGTANQRIYIKSAGTWIALTV